MPSGKFMLKKSKTSAENNNVALFVTYLDHKWAHIPPKALEIYLFLDFRQMLQYMMQTDPMP